MEVGSKRKRDLDCPRITYNAPNRSFDRLFKEESLEELKTVVRKKLGLEPSVAIVLSQIRADASIDLEDEDDFDAFYNAIHTASTATIRVAFENTPTPSSTVTSKRIPKDAELSTSTPGKKKRKLNDGPTTTPARPSTSVVSQSPAVTTSAVRKRAVSFAASTTQQGEQSSKRQKNTSASATITPPQPETSPPSSVDSPTDSVEEVETTTSTSTSSTPGVEPIAPAAAVPSTEKSSKPKSKKATGTPATPLAEASAIEAPVTVEPKKKIHKKKTAKQNATAQLAASSSADNTLAPTLATADSQQTVVESSTSREIVQSAAVETAAPEIPALKEPKKRSKKAVTVQEPITATEKETPSKAVKPKPKEKPKGKAGEAKTSAVDSESTNKDRIPPEANNENNNGGPITSIARKMIEKYLINDSVPEDAERSVTEAETVSAKAPPAVFVSPKCPYCGRPLTHKRSHCPMIRALPATIEQRINALREDTSEDPDGARASIIKELDVVLTRKLAQQKKQSNVASNTISSAKPIPSVTKSASTAKAASSSKSKTSPPATTKISTPALSAAPKSISPIQHTKSSSTSSTSTSSDSEDDVPLNRVQPPSVSTSPQKAKVPSSSQPRPQSQLVSSYSIRNQAQRTKDDGSDTSSDSSDDDDDEPLKNPLEVTSIPLSFTTTDIPQYTDQELEDIIRGPSVLLKISHISSSESSSSSDDEENNDIVLDKDSEEDMPRKLKRQSFAMTADSSDEDDAMEDNDAEELYTPSPTQHISGPPTIAPATSHFKQSQSQSQSQNSQTTQTFQAIAGGTSSEENDKAGDEAFEDALAEENAVFALARSTSSPGPTQIPHLKSPVTKTPGDVEMLDQTVDLDHDQDISIAKQRSSASEPEHGNEDNGKAPEEQAQHQHTINQDPEADPIEVEDDNLEINHAGSPIQIDDDDDDVGEGLPTPQEAHVRQTTPKPGLVRRMRDRAGLPSPAKKNSSVATVTPITPVAKPQSTRAATLRRRTGTRSQSVGLAQEEEQENQVNEAPVIAKPASRKKRIAAGKAAATRSTTTVPIEEEEVAEEVRTTRRSTRTSTRSATLATPTPAKPTSKRTRATSKAIMEEPEEPEVSQPKEVVKESKMRKKVESSKAITPSPPEAIASSPKESQSGVPDALLPSPPMSLNNWVSLNQVTPLPDTQSDMIDELISESDPVPSSLTKPQFQRKIQALERKKSLNGGDATKGKEMEVEEEESTESPLFISSETQNAFPYSQFQTQTQTQREQTPEQRSSDEEREVVQSVLKPKISSQPSKYRRLTDIASQSAKLFTPKLLRQSAGGLLTANLSRSTKGNRKDRIDEMYGKIGRKNGDDESQDDSGSDSDDEAKTSSHIPQSRRAGALLKGRMSLA